MNSTAFVIQLTCRLTMGCCLFCCLRYYFEVVVLDSTEYS